MFWSPSNSSRGREGSRGVSPSKIHTYGELIAFRCEFPHVIFLPIARYASTLPTLIPTNSIRQHSAIHHPGNPNSGSLPSPILVLKAAAQHVPYRLFQLRRSPPQSASCNTCLRRPKSCFISHYFFFYIFIQSPKRIPPIHLNTWAQCGLRSLWLLRFSSGCVQAGRQITLYHLDQSQCSSLAMCAT